MLLWAHVKRWLTVVYAALQWLGNLFFDVITLSGKLLFQL